ncbi:sugar transferase [Nocardioides sp. GCM10028917]|uniref:sugar transferase n=1 Tax=Nocardioides sp. GCM10028917 TaxID=3273408 RepID=UPI00360B3B6C
MIDWRQRHARLLLLGDLIVLSLALGTAQVAQFGLIAEPQVDGLGASYAVLGLALAGMWWLSLQMHQARSPKVVGHGWEEYRRVIVATFRVFAVLAMLSVALKMDASRLYLATAFPLGLVGLLVERKLARVSLHRARMQGEAAARVLVIGGERAAAELATWFDKHKTAGYDVCGVWIPDERQPLAAITGDAPRGVPVMSSTTDFTEALARSGATTVVVTDTEHLGHASLRDLAWQLEGSNIDLILSPNVLNVSSSRLFLQDVSGMPMLHVSEPQYAAAARLSKRLFDIVGASIVLLTVAPLFVATAIAVKVSSTGRVFYRQERIGRNGERFGMIKFRSMRSDADSQLAALLKAEGKSLAELPKLAKDPRVTRVGSFIRRFSIDELPQLVNVLRGDMSLVGPRPQRDFEVAQYDNLAKRRLTVRPGMTGLWQVSGRSDLAYAEAIDLDVHYVENWSMMTDVTILWRTLRAVLGSDGAY